MRDTTDAILVCCQLLHSGTFESIDPDTTTGPFRYLTATQPFPWQPKNGHKRNETASKGAHRIDYGNAYLCRNSESALYCFAKKTAGSAPLSGGAITCLDSQDVCGASKLDHALPFSQQDGESHSFFNMSFAEQPFLQTRRQEDVVRFVIISSNV